MITRRSLDGALKCALRDFLREEATAVVEVWSASCFKFRHAIGDRRKSINVFRVDARRNAPW
jgi:hypothetical protein